MKLRSLALASVVLLTLAAGCLLAGKYNAVITIGMQSPTFSNLPATDGKTYSMSDFKEDALVLVFLADHCPWVKGGEPDLIRTVSEFAGQERALRGHRRQPPAGGCSAGYEGTRQTSRLQLHLSARCQPGNRTQARRTHTPDISC